MRYAIVNNEKVKAFKNGVGKCPICNEPVNAYCGKIVVDHWKHKSLKDCDSWSEGMTQWHIDWQNCFPKSMQEVTLSKNGEKHRADIFNEKRGLTIEFQNSPISIEKILERELFYGKMVWVINLIPKKDRISIEEMSAHRFNFNNDMPFHFSLNHSSYKRFDFDYYELNEYGDMNVYIDEIYSILLIKLTIEVKNICQEQNENTRKELNAITLSQIVYNNTQGYYNAASNESKKNIKIILEKLLKINKDYYKAKDLYNPESGFFYFTWKHKSKIWEKSKKSKFLDIGDNYLYKIYKNNPDSTTLTVRKIIKSEFITECKKESITTPKKMQVSNQILIKTYPFLEQEKSQIEGYKYKTRNITKND